MIALMRYTDIYVDLIGGSSEVGIIDGLSIKYNLERAIITLIKNLYQLIILKCSESFESLHMDIRQTAKSQWWRNCEAPMNLPDQRMPWAIPLILPIFKSQAQVKSKTFFLLLK